MANYLPVGQVGSNDGANGNKKTLKLWQQYSENLSNPAQKANPQVQGAFLGNLLNGSEKYS
jgi:hypothetical protein